MNNKALHAARQSSVSVLIVTGQSGSGKSVALAALEDAGFYCIDNLPPELLGNLLEIFEQGNIKAPSIAIGIDARSSEAALADLPQRITELKRLYPKLKIQSLYLEASIPRIVARFSETRRRHPLSNRHENLLQAIEQEADMLTAMRQQADLLIDTSNTTVHQIREDLHQRLLGPGSTGPVILLQSFGFKNGIPLDSDFVFDIRHLPNPHWLADLRGFNGQSEVIGHYLEQHPITGQTRLNLRHFIQNTLTELIKTDRSYVTCSIGCTGGKHRSVYMVEQLFLDLKPIFSQLLIRHRDLDPAA
ncbi:MAG: RNase adaptor protein RapZ [Halothiobacillus sp. 24-54-40]|nr:RNase adapter RapZ [Halothiobacillaceae bacterium]OYV47502.1 MAG: RNase adaptor protein RapZ [Halothiobacillus sp. 20-53-49]OYY33706.1 MAG: RNase adaptor protein RapZ [Halothiobacillus sp. 35-54-62]OYZ86749.1 MAG: RNase adaptor protein RapZ [Halothiobacillus sp. 24-54-40]OZA79678.1 MAG: RNase adaptor protein RapZ [Halothiobacillus sp. 39-53-45]HQS02758.1 RNase adapter RapZ [Halothiobacillus sp.]